MFIKMNLTFSSVPTLSPQALRNCFKVPQAKPSSCQFQNSEEEIKAANRPMGEAKRWSPTCDPPSSTLTGMSSLWKKLEHSWWGKEKLENLTVWQKTESCKLDLWELLRSSRNGNKTLVVQVWDWCQRFSQPHCECPKLVFLIAKLKLTWYPQIK